MYPIKVLNFKFLSNYIFKFLPFSRFEVTAISPLVSEKSLFLHGKKTEGFSTRSVAQVPIRKKKCRSSNNLNVGAETEFLGASTLKNFIVFVQRFSSYSSLNLNWHFRFLVCKPVSRDRLSQDCSKICTKVVPSVLHLNSPFQVSTFSCFEVAAISASGCRKIVNFARKNRNKQRNLTKTDAKRRGSPEEGYY